jgi:hypothetical protein
MQKTTKTHRQKCLEAAAEVRAKRHPGILDFDALKDLTTANVVVALLGVLEKQGMEIRKLQRQVSSLEAKKTAKKRQKRAAR